MNEIIKPDLKRCQAEKSDATFLSMGGQHKWVRCENKPIIIATEKKAGKDGKIGSMSLCGPCQKSYLKHCNTPATFKRIKKDNPHGK